MIARKQNQVVITLNGVSRVFDISECFRGISGALYLMSSHQIVYPVYKYCFTDLPGDWEWRVNYHC